jgi:hypothetical protein
MPQVRGSKALCVIHHAYVVALRSYYAAHTLDTLQQRSSYVVLIFFR